MKLNISKIILSTVIILFFTACGPTYRAQTLQPSTASSHDFIMVANYDSVCENDGSKADFIVKKGDLFKAVDIFSGKQAYSMTEGTILKVPEHVLHLHAYTHETFLVDYTWFFEVYPDGTFSTVGSAMLNCLEASSTRRNCVYIEGSCKLKGNKSLFSKRER